MELRAIIKKSQVLGTIGCSEYEFPSAYADGIF
jgi:hypothetical protein